MTAPEGNLIPEWLSIGTSPKEQKKKTGWPRAGSDWGGKTGCKKWQKGSRPSKKAFEWNKQKKWRRQPSTVGSTVRTTNETSSLRFKLSTWGVLSVSLVYFLGFICVLLFYFWIHVGLLSGPIGSHLSHDLIFQGPKGRGVMRTEGPSTRIL